jgi:hypothetical protein
MSKKYFPIAESKSPMIKKKEYLDEIRELSLKDNKECPECKWMEKPYKESSGFSFIEIQKSDYKMFEIKKKKIPYSDRTTCYYENILILKELMKK